MIVELEPIRGFAVDVGAGGELFRLALRTSTGWVTIPVPFMLPSGPEAVAPLIVYKTW